MSTQIFKVNDSQYQLISEEDCIIENKSSYIVRLVAAKYTPTAGDENFHALRPDEQYIKRFKLPEENLYAICENSNQIAVIAVSDGMFEQKTDRDLLEAVLLEIAHLRAITQETYDSSITKQDIEDC